MKRMATLVLALLLLLSMAVPAMAENSNKHTITITNTNLPDGHEYTAYQVFKGDLVVKDGKKILTNIDWGTGVNGAKLLDALKKDETIGSKFAKCESAMDVADEMEGFNDDQTKAFAAVVANCLSGTVAGTSAQTKAPYTITVDDGYYFIKDKNENLDNTKVDAITRYMLQVVGDVEVKVKAVVPSIEKKIVENENSKVDANNASIGDVVNYELTSAVPDMTHYDQFYFVIHDTLSEGLTFNNDIVVKIGNNTLTENTDYEVKRNENGETFRIVFKNFVDRNEAVGTTITVTYSATLNEKAELGTAGNPNTVHLEYSNNPNVKGEGVNEPGENDKNITGETPKDTVYTYVTGIKLTKTDESDKPLTGAKFSIAGDSANVVVINKKIYRESESGTYYRLKNGNYTTIAPTEATKNQYDGEEKYEEVTAVEKTTVTEKIVKEGWVGTDGVISFEGLGEGTYTITELIAPEGYNLLEEPIYIKIEWTKPTETSTECTWTAKQVDKDGNALKNGEQDITLQLEKGVFTISVKNKYGNTLPSTGGIGTTVFYAVGGLLLVGAVIVMITRKRMSAEK